MRTHGVELSGGDWDTPDKSLPFSGFFAICPSVILRLGRKSLPAHGLQSLAAVRTRAEATIAARIVRSRSPPAAKNTTPMAPSMDKTTG
jgi:hypothetical protein